MFKQNKKGFTLMEMVIVIAIIAILGLLLAPQITNYRKNIGKTVCTENRQTLITDVTLDLVLTNFDFLKVKTYYSDEELAKIKICPNNGNIQFSFDELTSKFNFICDIHGGILLDINFSELIKLYMSDELKAKLVELLDRKGSSGILQIDSNAPAPNNYATEVQLLLSKLSNGSIGTGITTTWAMTKINKTDNTISDTYKLYWSSADIEKVSPNSKILMMYFDASNSKYQVKWVNVKENQEATIGNGKVYHIIEPDNYENVCTSSTNYEEVYEAYLKELNKNGSPVRNRN